MFAKTGGKNDHPGWHHFNTTGNGVNTSVVCVYCCKLFHDSEVGQLLEHLETVHVRVDVTWMRFVVERSSSSRAVDVKTVSSSGFNHTDGIESIVGVEGTIREVKREASLPVSNFTELRGSSNITETYEPTEFDDPQPSSSSSLPQRALSPMSSWLTEQTRSRTFIPSVPQTLEELESQSVDRSYRTAGRFTDIEAFDKCRLKLNLVHRCVGRLVVKTLYECQSVDKGCPFIAMSLHTAIQHGLYTKNDHHSQNCQIEGEKQYQKYLSEPRFLTLLDLETEDLFDTWKLLGYYESTEAMEKAIEEANLTVKTSNIWHFHWHRIYYKCRNSPSCKYQVLTVSNFKEIGMYHKDKHTCKSGLKKKATLLNISESELASLDRIVANLADQTLSWTAIGRFNSLNDLHAAQDKQVVAREKSGSGQSILSYYRCRRANFGCNYQQLTVYGNGVFGLYEHGEHEHQKVNVKTRADLKRPLSVSVEPESVSGIMEDGYDESEEPPMAAPSTLRKKKNTKGRTNKGKHTYFKKTGSNTKITNAELASLNKIVASLPDPTVSWTAIGHFTNFNDLHAAQDRQVVAREKGTHGQSILSYYRCCRSNFGCNYQQLTVSGTEVFGLYEHGKHEHEKVNVKTRSDLKRSLAESVVPDAVSGVVEDGYDKSEAPQMATAPPPVYFLLDRFRDLDELNDAKDQFPLIFLRAHPKNKPKRRRLFYSCEKKKTTGCTYRMATLAAPYLYQLFECGEHNHDAEDPATLIAPVKQRHDALNKVFEEPPPKKEKVVKAPKPVEKLPKTPPKKYPEMDEAISATGPPWKFLQSLPDRQELTTWYQSHSLMTSCATHLGTVSREYYRCVHYPAYGCGYIVQALTDNTRFLLYESGKHEHPFERRNDDESGSDSIKLPSGGTAKRVFCMRF